MEKLVETKPHFSLTFSSANPPSAIGIHISAHPINLAFHALLMFLFVAAVWQGVSAWREIHAPVAEKKENDPCAIETLD
jgi:hypothetical protein